MTHRALLIGTAALTLAGCEGAGAGLALVLVTALAGLGAQGRPTPSAKAPPAERPGALAEPPGTTPPAPNPPAPTAPEERPRVRVEDEGPSEAERRDCYRFRAPPPWCRGGRRPSEEQR